MNVNAIYIISDTITVIHNHPTVISIQWQLNHVVHYIIAMHGGGLRLS